MSVKGVFTKIYNRHFGNPEAVVLLLFITFIIFTLYYLGSILLPLLISIVLAYLLEWPVGWLKKCHIPRTYAVCVIFTLFITVVILICLWLIPVLKQQLTALITNLPDMFAEGKKLLVLLKSEHPGFISHEQIDTVVNYVRNAGTTFGKNILSFSIASITNILTVLFYIFLVPLFAFFLLKDKDEFIKQAKTFMPEDSHLIKSVWQEVHHGLGNYISGKFLEALIVGCVTFAVVFYYNLQYSILLSFLVGVSVFFPYIGAIVATIPLALVGMFEMGVGIYFIQLIIIYLVIQFLDGYVLAPYIFSEAINIHPLIIIIAIMLFGGLFGFWGIFFAVPLAIFVKAIIKQWPGYQE